VSNKVLILGGAGFIGFNIADKLAQKGDYDITIADNFFRGKMDSTLSKLVNDYIVNVVTGDFTEKGTFQKLDKDYDQVYMLASVVGVDYTQKMPDKLIQINSSLILNTLEWLQEGACKKVIFTSTSECYAGTIDTFGYKVPTPEEIPLTIADIDHPRFTYAITKMLGESGFLQYAKVHNFECTIIRYHNVYGPRMGFKHVIPQVVQRFLDGENPFKVYGYNQTRAFNYIDDAVKGTITAMESSKTNGEVLHLGDPNSEISIEELVHYIGELLNFKGEFNRKAAHSGSVSRRCPDISKAEKLIGYKPEIQWKKGVKDTVSWYQNYLTEGGDVFE